MNGRKQAEKTGDTIVFAADNKKTKEKVIDKKMKRTKNKRRKEVKHDWLLQL